MRRSAWLAGLLATAVLAVACKDEKEPVDIRFDGIEVGDSDGKGNALPTSSATADVSVAKPAPRTGGGSGGGISGCCGALQAKSNRSKESGAKAMYKQAAAVCFSKSKQVRSGKLTRSQALAQVRSSLLDAAPGACR
jgi:hypothetical protein